MKSQTIQKSLAASKPAIVSQLKVHAGRYMFRYCDASADDVLYEPLPLYHSAASILGVGSTINNGMFEAFYIIRSLLFQRFY